MKTLTIERSKWGTGDEGGSLLNEKTSKMCCLGFACLALGASRSQILGKSMPQRVADIRNKDTNNIFIEDSLQAPQNIKATILSLRAAGLNDNTKLSAEVREQKLTELFAAHGIELTFVD